MPSKENFFVFILFVYFVVFFCLLSLYRRWHCAGSGLRTNFLTKIKWLVLTWPVRVRLHTLRGISNWTKNNQLCNKKILTVAQEQKLRRGLLQYQYRLRPGPPVNCNDKLAVEIFFKLANITVRIFAKPLLREEKVQWGDKMGGQPGHNWTIN